MVVGCDEGEVKKVEEWLKRAMVDGMGGVFNAPDAEGPHVPVEVERSRGAGPRSNKGRRRGRHPVAGGHGTPKECTAPFDPPKGVPTAVGARASAVAQ